MIVIAINNKSGKKIAFTNNTDARVRLEKEATISEVLILGKYDLGFPDTNVTTTSLNEKDGQIIDYVKYEKRVLQFNTNFLGQDEITISKTRQALASVMNSQQERITLEFYRDNDHKSQQELFYLRNVVGKIVYESRDGQRLTSSQNCLLEFVAYNPFFEKPEKEQSFYNSIQGQGKTYPFTYPFTYNFIEGDVGQIVNYGDVPTPFKAEFAGTLNASSLQKLDKSNAVDKEIKLKTGITIPDTQKFVVDTNTRTAEIDGVNAFAKLNPTVTRFFHLDSGQNNFKFLAGNNNANNSVKITWTERYISI